MAVCAALLVSAAAFGAAAGASTSASCNDGGRAICVAITDVDAVSHSVAATSADAAINRYTEYTVEVRNGGNATLTNGSVTVSLRDVVAGSAVASDGAFIGVPSGCTSTSTTSFTCPQPNLAAFEPAPVLHVFARTTANTLATHMQVDVTASFNERGNDSEGPASQTDTFTWSEQTSLEGDGDFSSSVYFTGAESVALTTTSGQGGQASVFRIPGADVSGSAHATLTEFDPGEAGYACPAGQTCFGQSVSVSAPGVFSATRPANLRSTIALSLLPPGVTERSLRVHHDGAAFTRACAGPIGAPPAAAELPCRRVTIDRRAAIVTVDAWDVDQGDWGFS